jgi:formylglycine-generating enzyme required for sulfatase activity
MGSPAAEAGRQADETPHQVTISKEYWIGDTEVTQKQWRTVMGTTPWQGQDYTTTGDDVAATYVSWKDAVDFCAKLTDVERKAGRLPDGMCYTLPSEAEWELACRGSAKNTTAFCYGDDERKLVEYAVFAGCRSGQHAGVARGNRKANASGLFDMHGNVWEWCADAYASYAQGVQADPLPLSGAFRVLRGGSWLDEPKYCRSARRYSNVPSFADSSLGFRPVLVARHPVK